MTKRTMSVVVGVVLVRVRVPIIVVLVKSNSLHSFRGHPVMILFLVFIVLRLVPGMRGIPPLIIYSFLIPIHFLEGSME